MESFPQENETFPVVSFKLSSMTNEYTDLSYSEESFTFCIDIKIYAKDQKKEDTIISKRIIASEITNHIVDYLKTNYRITLNIEFDTEQKDFTIYKNTIKVTGILDVKKDHLVIYPIQKKGIEK